MDRCCISGEIIKNTGHQRRADDGRHTHETGQSSLEFTLGITGYLAGDDALQCRARYPTQAIRDRK